MIDLCGANRGLFGLLVRLLRLSLGELLAAYGIGAIVDGVGAVVHGIVAIYGVGAIEYAVGVGAIDHGIGAIDCAVGVGAVDHAVGATYDVGAIGVAGLAPRHRLEELLLRPDLAACCSVCVCVCE